MSMGSGLQADQRAVAPVAAWGESAAEGLGSQSSSPPGGKVA